MMTRILGNAATLEIHNIGLGHNNWLLDKNDDGLPMARDQHGLRLGAEPEQRPPVLSALLRQPVRLSVDRATIGPFRVLVRIESPDHHLLHRAVS